MAAAAVLSDHFSGEEALLQLGKHLEGLSAAPDSAAAALAAAAVSVVLASAAENSEEWCSEDESDVHEVAMVAPTMLREVHRFVTGSSCNQMALDALSLVLPNPIAKLGALCFDLSAGKDIIERFASKCSPRDNLLILCEAIDRHCSIQVVRSSSYFIILLDGIGKVLPLIQRHRAQNIQMAMRAVIGCVKYTVYALDEHNGRNAIDLFNASFRFSNIIQEMCLTMVDEEKEEVSTVLGLFALQNIAFLSQSKQEHQLVCGPLAIGYSQLAIASGFSWKGLLTGNDIGPAIGKSHEELVNSDLFSLAMEGAHLSVSWMNKHHDEGQSSMLEILSALGEINLAYTDKWRAVGMFMYVLPSRKYQWDVKSYSLDFLSHFHESGNEKLSQHERLLSAYVTIEMIKEIESMRISAPDESVRTKAYAGIKKIIRMLPQCERLTVLEEVIKDSSCPVSTGYLLDMVKDYINTESNYFNELEDYEALSPCFKDILPFLFQNLSGPYRDNLDSWGKVLYCLNLLKYLLIRGSRTLSKPVVRRFILELLYPLRNHLAARPIGNDDCAIQEAIAREAVDNCKALAEALASRKAVQ